LKRNDGNGVDEESLQVKIIGMNIEKTLA